MKRSSTLTVTLLPALSEAAVMHAAMMLLAFRDAPIADHVGMLLWWGMLIVGHGVLSLYLRQPRELRSIVLVCAALLVCQLGLTIWLNPVYPSLLCWFAAVCMWAAGYYRCAASILAGVKPEALMVNFELAATSLLAAGAISGSNAISAGILFHLAAALLCSLVAMMGLRTMHTRVDDSGGHSAAGLLMPLILLISAGCALLLRALVSGSASELLTVVTAWLGRTLRAIANGVGDVVYWLLSLLPAASNDVGNMGGFEAVEMPTGDGELVTESSGAVLYLLIGAIILGLLVVLMKMWRTVSLGGKSAPKVKVRTVTVKKRSFASLLRRFLGRVMGRVRFELQYLRSRNTAAGLLVWLERRMRRKGKRRTRGETPAAFLARVGECAPQCAEGLLELSVCLDRHYFGSGDELPTEQIRGLRRALKKEL